MSKISYSVMKKLKMERLLKRQANFDHVIVFDEEFENKYNFCNKNYWLISVDFCTTYKYDPNCACVKTATYKDIVDKANNWISQLPQYVRNDRLVLGQPIWTIISCETLYAKISINFSENGEIIRKRVMQFSKWPLNDELFMNLYCENNTMSQNFEQIFNGRYIVVLLRIWMAKQPYYPLMLIGEPPMIIVKDYWPQTITVETINQGKKLKKSGSDLRRKFRKTLSIDNSQSSGHGESKECLEKIEEITNRINEDIVKNKINGNILNVVTFPCFYHKEMIYQNFSENKIEVGKIPVGHIVNLVRIFSLGKRNTNLIQDNQNALIENNNELIGFIHFVPKCISGGGFIKYPKFETQSDIIDKATMWLSKNPQYKLLNFTSVDIKLKSMTSSYSGEMTFSRNTGDFVRILRLCYLRSRENNNMDRIINWSPRAMIYLQRKNIISINNSIKELQQQMNDYLMRAKKVEQNHDSNGERWRFLGIDSVAIFISHNSNSRDSKNRRNNLMADCDKSFHAISISSSSMNRNMLNGFNIYYDIGFHGQRSKTTNNSKSFYNIAE